MDAFNINYLQNGVLSNLGVVLNSSLTFIAKNPFWVQIEFVFLFYKLRVKEKTTTFMKLS